MDVLDRWENIYNENSIIIEEKLKELKPYRDARKRAIKEIAKIKFRRK